MTKPKKWKMQYNNTVKQRNKDKPSSIVFISSKIQIIFYPFFKIFFSIFFLVLKNKAGGEVAGLKAVIGLIKKRKRYLQEQLPKSASSSPSPNVARNRAQTVGGAPNRGGRLVESQSMRGESPGGGGGVTPGGTPKRGRGGVGGSRGRGGPRPVSTYSQSATSEEQKKLLEEERVEMMKQRAAMRAAPPTSAPLTNSSKITRSSSVNSIADLGDSDSEGGRDSDDDSFDSSSKSAISRIKATSERSLLSDEEKKKKKM